MTTTYSQLQADVRAWIARDDLSDAQVQSFIAMAEARINRLVDAWQKDETFSAIVYQGDGYATLPTGYAGFRSIQWADNLDFPLSYVAPQVLANFSTEVTGRPQFFTVYGTRIAFERSADADYTLIGIMNKNLTPLSDSTTTNWLTETHQDVLLWGALCEASSFGMDHEQAAVWKAKFDQGIAEIRAKDKREKYGPAPTIRVDRYCP